MNKKIKLSAKLQHYKINQDVFLVVLSLNPLFLHDLFLFFFWVGVVVG